MTRRRRSSERRASLPTIYSTGMASRPLLDVPASFTESPSTVACVYPPQSIVWIRETPVAIWSPTAIGTNVSQMARLMPKVRQPYRDTWTRLVCPVPFTLM